MLRFLKDETNQAIQSIKAIQFEENRRGELYFRSVHWITNLQIICYDIYLN